MLPLCSVLCLRIFSAHSPSHHDDDHHHQPPIGAMFLCMVGLAKPCLGTNPCSATTAERWISRPWWTSTMTTSTIRRITENAGAIEVQQTRNWPASTGYVIRWSRTRARSQIPLDCITMWFTLRSSCFQCCLVLNKNPLNVLKLSPID